MHYFHTDITGIPFSFVREMTKKRPGSVDLAFAKLILDEYQGENVWFPAFNYDFPKSGIFDVDEDNIKTGAINSAVHRLFNTERTPNPIFSHVGVGDAFSTNTESEYSEFSKESDFYKIYQRNGTINLLGCGVESLTFIHLAEEICKVPYRYYKTFKGIVKNKGLAQKTSITYRVRPQNMYFQYDWEKLSSNLKRQGILQESNAFGFTALQMNSRDLNDFLIDSIRFNPYYLLNDLTRAQLLPVIESLGRGILWEDFESV